jgi:NAD dependent epimerase/dehydratase family enzyme
MLRLMFGEFGSILLMSQRAVPKGALSAGFEFKYPELQAALADIFSKQSAVSSKQ